MLNKLPDAVALSEPLACDVMERFYWRKRRKILT
jgi:hypothetical protein